MPGIVPRKLPPVRSRARSARAVSIIVETINGLIDAVNSLQPRSSFQTKTSHTATGVLREGKQGGEEGEAGLVWYGAWDSASGYPLNAVVIRATEEDIQSGLYGGTYVCVSGYTNADTDFADIRPGEEDPAEGPHWELMAEGSWEFLRVTEQLRIGASAQAAQVIIIPGDVAERFGEIRLRETMICENGVNKLCVVLRSNIVNP